MTTEGKHGLYRRQTLTQAELADIRQLADICNKYENLDLKLNWDVLQNRSQNLTNDFLYYEDDQLVGFLALFSFSSKEAEISGMVHPAYRRQHTFAMLFHFAYEEIKRRRIPKLILIVEHASQSGKAFAISLGASYGYSEYKMLLRDFKEPESVNEQLTFRPARVEDAQALARITAVSFNVAEDEIDWYVQHVTQESQRRFYIGILGETPVGKIDVTLNAYEAVIYGFGVLPEYQGQGFGKKILVRTIQEIRASGQQRIALEVATENKQALALYHSCGFVETSIYDYYNLPVIL